MKRFPLIQSLRARGYTLRRFRDGGGRIHAWVPPGGFTNRIANEWHIGNLGAGVQSTDLYLRRSKEIDVWIFADTKDEQYETYHHLVWLIDQNRVPIVLGSRGQLSADLFRGENSSGGRFASIPAFTAPDHLDWIGAARTLADMSPADRDRRQGRAGKMQRQCTKEYKIEVIETVIRRLCLNLSYRERKPKVVSVHQYFGISADEAGRASKIYERSLLRHFTAHFILLEENQTRADCARSLVNLVPHEVPKSACKFCPFRDDYGWKLMKENSPADFEDACFTDDGLRIPGRIVNRNLNQSLYLHRSCIPLRDIDFSKAKPREETAKQLPLINLWGMNHECEGVCGI